MTKPTLLMIRPLEQAMDFVQALPALTGKMPKTIYAPVIETRAVANVASTSAQFLLFSSVNGVKFYSAQTEGRAIPVLCVGDTTAKAAQAAGFSAQSAGGTAADLLHLALSVADPKLGPLIYVCGAMVAHDLDGKLRNKGFAATRHVVYEQVSIELTKAARIALASPTVIPVSSPNTARIFARQTADMNLSCATFAFISENARAPLAHLDSAQILAKTPTRDGMIAAIAPLL